MNVLNIDSIERELRNIAARAVYPQARKWLHSVARNYILNISGPESESEYQPYTSKRPKKGIHTDLPEPEMLPDWAKRAVEDNVDLHFFDPAQPRRRQLWQDLEAIVDWFNTWSADDPALNRLDRVGFGQAREQALAWRKEIDTNPWLHIKDKPQVVKDYGDGMKWVILSTDMHMQREGELMQHCVGGPSYCRAMKDGTSEFYSLRDSKNEPHVTVEVYVSNGQRTIRQMKGKQNARAIGKYQPYLVDFVREKGWNITGDRDKIDL